MKNFTRLGAVLCVMLFLAALVVPAAKAAPANEETKAAAFKLTFTVNGSSTGVSPATADVASQSWANTYTGYTYKWTWSSKKITTVKVYSGSTLKGTITGLNVTYSGSATLPTAEQSATGVSNGTVSMTVTRKLDTIATGGGGGGTGITGTATKNFRFNIYVDNSSANLGGYSVYSQLASGSFFESTTQSTLMFKWKWVSNKVTSVDVYDKNAVKIGTITLGTAVSYTGTKILPTAEQTTAQIVTTTTGNATVTLDTDSLAAPATPTPTPTATPPAGRADLNKNQTTYSWVYVMGCYYTSPSTRVYFPLSSYTTATSVTVPTGGNYSGTMELLDAENVSSPSCDCVAIKLPTYNVSNNNYTIPAATLFFGTSVTSTYKLAGISTGTAGQRNRSVGGTSGPLFNAGNYLWYEFVTPTNFTLSFNANLPGNGTVASMPATKTANNMGEIYHVFTIEATVCPIYTTGTDGNAYEFKGWAASDTATEPTYAVGAERNVSVPFNVPSLQLYAVWQEPEVTWNVTYNSNGGSTAAFDTVTDGESFTLPATGSFTNFTLVGWVSEASAQIVTGTVIAHDNLVYYACWIPLAPTSLS